MHEYIKSKTKSNPLFHKYIPITTFYQFTQAAI